MNPRPHLHGLELLNTGCGHVALANRDAYLWQSYMTTAGNPAPFPAITNLPELAREIRRTYTTTGEDNHD